MCISESFSGFINSKSCFSKQSLVGNLGIPKLLARDCLLQLKRASTARGSLFKKWKEGNIERGTLQKNVHPRYLCESTRVGVGGWSGRARVQNVYSHASFHDMSDSLSLSGAHSHSWNSIFWVMAYHKACSPRKPCVLPREEEAMMKICLTMWHNPRYMIIRLL